ncbi:unnamed protein product [Ilex paraguariensis]|uniref:Uncharacterized protein n=1 Tax=Ilex paraguariensis TaxID=185542 RepID=A0ABC8U9H1_9AQUA
MGWFIRERRGISWRDQTLASLSPPFIQLLSFCGLVFLLLSFSSYCNYKAQMKRTMIGLRLFLFLLPVVLILIMHMAMANSNRWFPIRVPRPAYECISREGGSPWGVAAVVVVLLVMIYFQSSVQAGWFRPI